jgi:Ca2+-binding EF-hand superfamily protein
MTSSGTRIIHQVPPGATVIRQGAYQPSSPTIIRSNPGLNVIPTARQNVTSGPGLTQGAYETKHAQDDPQLANLKELRKTSGLKEVPVSEGLQAMKQAGGEDGKLTRDQFLAVYEGILTRHAVELPTETVRNAVFDLFDRDDNGIVDMMELICGISLLCAGSEDDKIHAVFDVFDENGDGFISMDEMYKFLTSVFKVVLTPNVMGVMNTMGVTVESPEDLASVTALECFKTADLNHDGKLSVAEFKNWFYAPRNDPSFLFSPVRKLLA